MSRITLLFFLLLIGCDYRSKSNKIDSSMSLFETTIAEKIVYAIKEEDLKKIEEILITDTLLLSYQEPKFGRSLVHLVAREKKCKSLQKLLELGTNSNLKDIYGETALFESIYNLNEFDSKLGDCISVLLEHDADPNTTNYDESNLNKGSILEKGTSVLMLASSRSYEASTMLVEYGANINYKTKTGKTAAIVSLLTKNLKVAYLLIVENKAKVTDSYNASSILGISTISEESKLNDLLSQDLYPIDLLSNWIFPIGSDEHFLKMEIVKEFENQGLEYRDRKIPERIIQQIKALYPNSWQDFLEKY
ncbi:MAG: ankyrin repeat domain-containing protein [Balneola sp.]